MNEKETLNGAEYNNIISFIWSVADDCLRDVYVRGKYRDVILPMTVIRRLDAVLEPTKQDVLKTKEMLDKNGVLNQGAALCGASGLSFYFTLKELLNSTTNQNLQKNFESYLEGFSDNVMEI